MTTQTVMTQNMHNSVKAAGPISDQGRQGRFKKDVLHTLSKAQITLVQTNV